MTSKQSKQDSTDFVDVFGSDNIPDEKFHGQQKTIEENTQFSSDGLIRKRKKHKVKKNNKPLKIALIVIAAILAIAIGICAALLIAMNVGQNSMKNQNLQMTDGKTVEYNGHTYVYNDNVISTLVMGYDQTTKDYNEGHSGQADFIMLVTLDTSNGNVKAISIPRDTMVDVGESVGADYAGTNNKKMQICLAYAYGDGRNTSCQYTTSAVSRLLYNMPINHYISLNLEGIGPINDSIGGVSLTPIETIPNTGIIEGQHVTLLGKNAQSYVQYRNEKIFDSAEMRRKRQVQYVSEFYSQALNTNNKIGTAVNLFNTAGQYSITNLGVAEFTYMAQVVAQSGVNTFTVTSIPGQNTMGQNYAEFYPDATKTYEIVLDTFYNKQD